MAIRIPKTQAPDLAKWLTCKRCALHHTRRKVVIGRGTIPCDVLFIGEAPGKSEDFLGIPFCGPTKRIMESGIARAATLAAWSPSVYYTNVLACRPCDTARGPNRVPTSDEAWACRDRLMDVIAATTPRRIVLVGDTAERFYRNAFPHAAHIAHPAFLLRTDGEQSPMFRGFVRGICEVFLELKGT
jgi:uracil-DNA glycosylase family 4